MALRPADAPVFNVCTGVATSVATLADLVADLAGRTLDARNGPPRAGEIRHSRGVPDRANAVLGLPARIPLRDGLTEVLRWMTGTSMTGTPR